jgi:hypothetical protein
MSVTAIMPHAKGSGKPLQSTAISVFSAKRNALWCAKIPHAFATAIA